MHLHRLFLSVALVTGFGCLSAQEHIIQGSTPDLYLSHTVSAKETWYSVARSYNLEPKAIVSYNKADMTRPLEIGQQIKVPLTKSNFVQDDHKGKGEVLVPVYHVVQEKEWLYRISVNHNKVPVEKIEKWNAIGRDDAKAGMKLIVGYLKVRQDQAAQIADNRPAPEVVSRPEALPPSVNTTPKPPVTTTTTTTKAPAVNTRPVNTTPASATAKKATGGEGYFKTLFLENGRAVTGFSGVFKSTSGWGDGKYYALMNNVAVGTIVKVSVPDGTKSVYAKVLGELPDMKESAGLSLRISDAAANILGNTGGKFDVRIAY